MAEKIAESRNLLTIFHCTAIARYWGYTVQIPLELQFTGWTDAVDTVDALDEVRRGKVRPTLLVNMYRFAPEQKGFTVPITSYVQARPVNVAMMWTETLTHYFIMFQDFPVEVPEEEGQLRQFALELLRAILEATYPDLEVTNLGITWASAQPKIQLPYYPQL